MAVVLWSFPLRPRPGGEGQAVPAAGPALRHLWGPAGIYGMFQHLPEVYLGTWGVCWVHRGNLLWGNSFGNVCAKLHNFFFFLASFYTLPPMSLREQQIPGYEPMKISSGFG